MKKIISLSLALLPMMASADDTISQRKAADIASNGSPAILGNAPSALIGARKNTNSAKIDALIGNWVFTYDIVDLKTKTLVAYTDRLILDQVKTASDGDIRGLGFVYENYTNSGLATECAYAPEVVGSLGDYYCLNFAASGDYVHLYTFKVVDDDNVKGYYSIGKDLKEAVANAQAKVTGLDGIREPIARYDGDTKMLTLPRVAYKNIPGLPASQVAVKFYNYGDYVFGFPPADKK